MKKSRFQKKKKPSLKIKIFGGLFFSLLIVLAYFFFFSSLLWVENVEVEITPSTQVVKDDLRSEIIEIVQQKTEQKLWQIIPQKNIVLVPTKIIKEEILARFPGIREVIIYKKSLNSLVVKVEERQNIGIWCQIEYIKEEPQPETATTTEVIADEEESVNQEPQTERKIKKCFYLDREGIIYKESPLISGNLILNIYSSQEQTVDIRSQVIPKELIDFILVIRNDLPKIKTALGLSLEAVDFESIALEYLRVTTNEGWQIYFNPTYSVDWQLRGLGMVLDEEIKEKQISLEYIDLRIERRVYYKTKEES